MTVKIKNTNPYGPLSWERLVNIENRIQKELPQDYRNFLLKYNGGQPVPSFFWIQPFHDGSGVYQFYGIHDGPIHLSIDTYLGEERYGIPNSMIPIGDDGMGNFICLGINSTNYGEIFFLDHDEHPYSTPDSMAGVLIISNTFDEFLHSLIEHPR